MTLQTNPRVHVNYEKRKKLGGIALIISAFILLMGIVAFSLQIARPNFDKLYDEHHSMLTDIETGAVNTHLNNLLKQNESEKAMLSAYKADAQSSIDSLATLEDALKTAQQTSNQVKLQLAGEEDSYTGPFMFMARHRMLILATGAILLVISLLYYVANNKSSKLCLNIVRDKWLYVLLMPGLIYFVIFKYLPMWGVIIAFQEYVPYSGIFASQWVGFDQFIRFFHTPMLGKLFKNTLLLSFMNLLLYFPAPIFLSLLLNEMRRERYKKLLQTFLYVPHFISIVIVVSITYVIFDSDGLIGRLTVSLLGKKIDFLTDPGVFRWMIVGQSIWKETGWGTIIFLAALTNVDVQLYEAAMVDGAGRMRQMWHITLPAIRSTIVLLLILRMGSVLDTGYDHLILMSNAMNREVSQTFDVFVYEQGINSADYSYATAVGLFKSVISVALVITSNKIAHALGEPGLY